MAYPLLYGTTPQADPGLAHTTAISNVTELQAMTATGNYYLTGNIDASATQTWNGGLGFAPISGMFTGSLDGCGYTISDLWIQRFSFVGLFEYLRPGCQIANLTLSNIHYKGTLYIGGLAAEVGINSASDVLVQNVHVTGSIEGDPSLKGLAYVGGMIGRCSPYGGSGFGYFYDCSTDVTIDQTNSNGEFRGGFVGRATENFIFHNCFSDGDLINPAAGSLSCIGGFAGKIDDGVSCYFCHATGDVDGGNDYAGVGGFVGVASGTAYFKSCYATGDAEGHHYVGGFFGACTGVVSPLINFEDCYAYGDATAYFVTSGDAGGFGGSANYTALVNCYSKGTAVATVPGGFIANGNVQTTAVSCYWDEQASGNYISFIGQGGSTRFFKKQSHFIGWDFATVWILSGVGKQIIMGKPRSSYPVQCPHTTHRNVYG